MATCQFYWYEIRRRRKARARRAFITMKQQIEIEYRARLDEQKYNKLKNFLDSEAKDLGGDDKDVYFFICPDKLLKVVNNVSKKSAEIVLKLNKIGKGSDFEEIIIPIEQKRVDKAVKLFIELNITDNVMRSFQKRHNYAYRGAELALKYSDIWGHHLELEKVIENKNKKTEAEKLLQGIAQKLDIKIMTDKELKQFTRKAEKDYKKALEMRSNLIQQAPRNQNSRRDQLS